MTAPQKVPKEAKKRIPRFRSLDEEAEFWQTHSPLDYPDQWVEVKNVKIVRPPAHILAVRLDAKTIGKLGAIGRKKGIGPSTLARIWIMERLSEIGEQEAEKAARQQSAQVESPSG